MTAAQGRSAVSDAGRFGSGHIEIDLPSDFAAFCRAQLAAIGYAAGGFDDRSSVRLWLSVQRRFVRDRPRIVQRAKEFRCPPEHRLALNSVERKVTAGEDLTPHLSRGIRDLEYNDHLLNHWGIHHLHLGTRVGGDGFVERTEPLLFVRFDDEHAYLLGVLPHDGSWTSQELVKTIHANWPDTLHRFRMPSGTGDALTDADVMTLRKRHINHVVTMDDGTVYVPPGGGTNSAGSSMLDTFQAHQYLGWAREQQNRIVGEFDAIRSRARGSGIAFADPAVFRLGVIGDTFCATELHSGYTLHLINP